MYIILTLGILVLLLLVFLVLINVGAYVKVKSNGIDLSFVNIVFSRLRGLNPDKLVDAYITLLRAGVSIEYTRIESHALCGGDVLSVVDASVSALKSSIDMDFEQLCKLDLAGRDVVSAVDSYVHPVVINCPSNKQPGYIVTVAKDGIRLGISVKLTVRSDLKSLIGGAGVLTVEARVQEKVLGAVGAAESHKDVLNNPSILVEHLQKESNALEGTYFTLVSVDVSGIKVLDNLKAKLDSIQSEADKKVAESRAEAQKADAKARQQEMKAKLQEMNANVVSARVVLPDAIKSGIDDGVLGTRESKVKNVSQWRSQAL
ncbi:hypothetical protein LNTAR_24661 [Lentisphaera araneosa HTCC2155]|uniref:Uncharacterized protein n=1 Tax=Lentisphaera araneosa HTCC2155 TaxID=313628 RepID=A6DTA3_9BACT|nr:flotillin-like FloA family protein [Lentisphaera araneosa]EDM25176.1 hypothetical protein LNTAR_24661 [Lentisphaera araneosa HTCC2155]